MIRRLHSGATPLLIAGIIFLAAVLVAAAVIWKLESHRLEAERGRVASLADDHAEALQSNLERTLSATYALAAMVRQGDGEFPAFEEVARQMLHYFPGADSLQLAPGGVTRRIVPLAGNEAGLGHDLLRDPLRNKEALLARDSKQLTLAGPFELIQGGIGVIGRCPVFLEDAGNERFWGFATVVIRFPKILEQIGLTNLSKRGIAYQLWRVHPDTGERQIIAASSAAPRGEAVEHTVNVPNGIWTLSLSPVAGWADPVGLTFKTAFGLLISTLLAWLAKLLVASKVHEAELETLVAERTAEIREGEQRLRLERDFSANVLDSLPGILYLFDEQLSYLRWNRNTEQVLGYSGEEFARMSPLDFFAGDDRQRVSEQIQKVFEQGTAEVEADLVTKSGARLPYYLTGTRILIEGRLCLLGVGVDIADRKRAEEALVRQAEELLRRNEELERFDAAAVERELRMIELKRQINALSLELGRPAPYDLTRFESEGAIRPVPSTRRGGPS